EANEPHSYECSAAVDLRCSVHARLHAVSRPARHYETDKIEDEAVIVNSSDIRFLIFSYGKNNRAMEAGSVYERDAIHATIFRGVPAGEVPPLYSKPKSKWTAEERKFWKAFFAVKDIDTWKKEKKKAPLVSYKSYAFVEGSPHPDNVLRYGKEMKIGRPIRVQREALRDYLKQEGIDVN
ncbi:MAG: hypothetical protein AAF149_18280, partial [Bacteroidota bacterium]